MESTNASDFKQLWGCQTEDELRQIFLEFQKTFEPPKDELTEAFIKEFEQPMEPQPFTSGSRTAVDGDGNGDYRDVIPEYPYYRVLDTTNKEIKKYGAKATQITLKLNEIQEIDPQLFIEKAFDKLLEEFVEKDKMKISDKLGITIGNSSFSKPIFITYRSPHQITSEIVLAEFNKVIQSNESFTSDGALTIKITHIDMPAGQKRKWLSLQTFSVFCEKKNKSIICIDNEDNLCLPRALAMSIAYLNKDIVNKGVNKLRNMRRKNSLLQTAKAYELCEKAGIDPENIVGDIDTIKIFQSYLTDYKITVYDGNDRSGRTVIFESNNVSSEKYIDLIYGDNHFNVITSLTGTFCSYGNMAMRYENTVRKMNYLQDFSAQLFLIEIWECQIKQMCAHDGDLKKVMDNDLIVPMIQNNREAFYGGHTETFCKHYKVDENRGEKIRYLDVNSLYPYVNKYGKYPIKHPKVLLNEQIPQSLNGVTGIAKVKILPPKKLYIPVLPLRVGGKLFPLCKTCAEQSSNEACRHSDSERAITGTYTCDEINKAIQKKYKILECFEVWSYETLKYDKETGQSGIFGGYIDQFLKIKQCASGFPANVVTEQQKIAFVEDLEKREGIRVDISEISYNPGLRSLSKLCLNSLWGKFGQRNSLQQTTVIKEQKDLYDLLSDPAVEVIDIQLNDETLYVNWRNIEEENIDEKFTNPILSAYVTSSARLLLYTYLEKLDQRVLYCGTDSIIYVERPGDVPIETGPYLGQMSDELAAYEGPKNYSYTVKTATGEFKTVVKVRGITLNHLSRQKINFNTMKEFVTEPNPETITIINKDKIHRKRLFNVVSAEQSKVYKPVQPKRRVLEDLSTLPLGYV